MLNNIIKYFLENKLVTVLILITIVAWGIATSPFNWDTGFLPKDPVPVDAIPDIGENQQIVFTQWPGRSPQDIEDQISYPMTTYLLGIPGVKTTLETSEESDDPYILVTYVVGDYNKPTRKIHLGSTALLSTPEKIANQITFSIEEFKGEIDSVEMG